jgi:DNA ligase-1
MQATTSGVMSMDGEPDFRYYVFDCWNIPDVGFNERIKRLNEAFQNLSWAGDAAEHLVLLPQALVNDLDELNKFESIALEHGFEGAMVRAFSGRYKQGRSTAREQHLLKIKRFADSEAVVIGFQQFMHNGNALETDELGYAKRSSAKDGKVPMDMLGALLVKDATTGIEFAIGTGYDMSLREWIWQNQDKVMGAIVTYKHFENAGVKDAPRFPVFKAFRDSSDL